MLSVAIKPAMLTVAIQSATIFIVIMLSVTVLSVIMLSAVVLVPL
jgi:hypothetical protein